MVWVQIRSGEVYGNSPAHYTNFMGHLIHENGDRYERDEIILTEEQEEERIRSVMAEGLLAKEPSVEAILGKE